MHAASLRGRFHQILSVHDFFFGAKEGIGAGSAHPSMSSGSLVDWDGSGEVKGCAESLLERVRDVTCLTPREKVAALVLGGVLAVGVLSIAAAWRGRWVVRRRS